MKKILLFVLALVGKVPVTNAQFSVYDKDGKVVFSMEETPSHVDFTYHKPTKGTANGHEWVDLGLSVKWSTMNVGASSPNDAGTFFAWGETASKADFDISTYDHLAEGYSNGAGIEKYQVKDNNRGGRWYDYENNREFIGDDMTSLDKSDDVAAFNWKGDWIMPTYDDWVELFSNTTQMWADDYEGSGVSGYVLTSNVEGHTNVSIFLPAAGAVYNDGVVFAGSKGHYWSKTLSDLDSGCGRSLYFTPDNLYLAGNVSSRCVGMSVRPVCPLGGNTNGHGAADFGLPSGKLWATCNVGADVPYLSGDHYAWGETATKEDYSWKNYKFMLEGGTCWQDINKYTTNDGKNTETVWYDSNTGLFKGDNKTVLESSDDVVTHSWGEKWRMPTKKEWEELFEKTASIWVENYQETGVNGLVLTSTVEGYTDVSIFLPAVGLRSDTDTLFDGFTGNYWTSELTTFDTRSALCIIISSADFWRSSYSRESGLSVRGVCP